MALQLLELPTIHTRYALPLQTHRCRAILPCRCRKLALFVTFIAGWIGIVIGHELLGGFPEFGGVIAIAVMGAFIIYFNEKKK